MGILDQIGELTEDGQEGPAVTCHEMPLDTVDCGEPSPISLAGDALAGSPSVPDKLLEFSPEDKTEIVDLLTEHLRAARSRYCPDACFLKPDRWVERRRQTNRPGRGPRSSTNSSPRVECSKCGKFIGFRVLNIEKGGE